MITGAVKNQVDQIWDAFWAGGIASPISVIEQMTYLLFIKGLDEAQSRKEKQAQLLGGEIENPIFPKGDFNNPVTKEKVPFEQLRWSRFKNLEPRAMHKIVSQDVFPFIKNLGDKESAFVHHMRDAIFLIPPEKAGLLARVVDMLDEIPMQDRDTKGDLYEYMLGKLSTAGDSGQFRTPRHIIKLMVDMVQPQTTDIICDPACGTAGFLVAAVEYFNTEDKLKLFNNEAFKQHYHKDMFNGFDFDSTMLRIAAMNMMLHGVTEPQIVNRDSLAEDHATEEDKYSLILANPPFAGSLDYESTAKDLLQVVKTKKTELLFLALFLRLLKPGGRAAVIVPDGVLFGSSNAHRELRRMLVEDHKLDGIVSMPSGVFKPYAGVSTAIVFFHRTDSGGTDNVWFYDMKADGLSLDDKRTELLSFDKLGSRPKNPLSEDEHLKNNLPDILKRWQNIDTEVDRTRTDQSFFVPKDEIAENDYDLSINRYKEVVYDAIEYDDPKVILKRIIDIEKAINEGSRELEGML
ncbi:type I restriction-modification system subunit M [Cerasicoccus fimbriatus]|uniref:type I restriction-modification system subunit M n=1 Tax=Cerasicoccus fimbriatus TaxID=3014554 RepID=UPI0022B306EC|nr:class I SAM-dependent DNA methyltransferase [Cerasicoccus sp. TK19100]